MNQNTTARSAFIVFLSVAAVLLLCGVAGAQSAQIQGVINGRSGATMTVQTQDSGNVVVLLNDYTSVEDVAGIFHARKKQMGLTVLEPGLQVQVQGNYNAQNQLVANTIKFNGKDLQTASDIQAGVTPVEQQEQLQKEQAAKQEAQIQKEQAAMKQQQQEMAAAQAKIPPTRRRSQPLTSALASWPITTSGMRSRYSSATTRSRLIHSTTLNCWRCARRPRRSTAT